MPKGTPVDISNGTKLCPDCEQTKPLNEFYPNKRTTHGYNVYCIECSYKRHDKWRRANKDQAAENGRRWRKNNPERFKDHMMKRHHGLPLGSYQKMLAEQNGCCAICGTDTPNGQGRFHLDHCHDTGKIRGLLCHSCNLAIGYFRDNIATIQSAIKYLTQTRN